MTIKVRITENFVRRGIDVVLYDEAPGGATVWGLGSDTRQYVRNDGTERVDIEPGTLSDDEARALLNALIRHYDGGEDTRSLRRDYDAERKRVDTFIAHLTGGAR